MHYIRPPSAQPSFPRAREILAALAAGGALCFGAKYLFAAILILFIATGGNP